MNHYDAMQRSRKLPAAKSTFMKMEEIDRERALSGWDPYRGETEGPGGAPEVGREPMYREKNGQGEAVCPPCGNGGIRPVADYTQIMQEQRETERDRRRLQSMYPQTAKLLLPAVEEVCDRMEYEGSPMFDETPDRTTIYRFRDQILVQMQGQLADQLPVQTPIQPRESALSMQSRGPGQERPGMAQPGQGGPGSNLLGDLIQVMLLDEIHQRRCRHRNCCKQTPCSI